MNFETVLISATGWASHGSSSGDTVTRLLAPHVAE